MAARPTGGGSRLAALIIAGSYSFIVGLPLNPVLDSAAIDGPAFSALTQDTAALNRGRESPLGWLRLALSANERFRHLLLEDRLALSELSPDLLPTHPAMRLAPPALPEPAAEALAPRVLDVEP